MAHRWLYIPDLASPTGWATHDAEHASDAEPADAIGFHRIEPVEDDEDELAASYRSPHPRRAGPSGDP